MCYVFMNVRMYACIVSISRPIANMATISLKRAFSVATVAKGGRLFICQGESVILLFFHSGNNKKLSRRSHGTNRNIDDRKNHDCDVLMCELILHFRL